MSRLRIPLTACALPLLLMAQAPDANVTFQSKVNLVPVPVVVRDKDAHAVGNLTQEDFQVFDNGKPQAITRFSVEKSGLTSETHAHPAAASAPASATPTTATPVNVVPDRFVGYVFDDLHFAIPDLMQARLAALKHFDAQDSASTRAAVFTTSGINPEDFTADRARLKAALNRLMPRTRAGTPQTDCPFLSYFMANMIVQGNSQALQDGANAAMACPVPPSSMQEALNISRMKASQVDGISETETRITLSVLRAMVRRIAALPGQRTLVLVSPGFIFPSHEQDVSQLIDLAVRLNVVINAIDGRGLYVDSRYDATHRTFNLALAGYETSQATQSGQTLSLIAEGTGGTAVLNDNDLLGAFRRTSAPPEFTYILGFSPENLKLDGKFHSIKVKLKKSSGMSLQARRGYFAPSHPRDPADEARQDIDDALFSRQELKDFPLVVQTQVTRNPDSSSKLTVGIQVGLKQFHFVQADGVNKDQLTLVAGLFDKDGNYVSGTESKVEMHYKDEILQARINTGLVLRTNFESVKPGAYLLRLVARDAEGKMLSTASAEVQVP